MRDDPRRGDRAPKRSSATRSTSPNYFVVRAADLAATRRIIGRQMIPTDRSSAPLRLRRLPDRIAAARAIDAAEAFRDLPGLVLLESARPGRNARWTYLTADPVAILETPAAGPDPFAVARRLVARLDRTLVVPADAPPFLGGLVGFLGYDLGGMLERLPATAPSDQDLLRSGSRSTTGSSRGTGGPAMRGSAVGPSTATGGGWRAGSTRSTLG